MRHSQRAVRVCLLISARYTLKACSVSNRVGLGGDKSASPIRGTVPRGLFYGAASLACHAVEKVVVRPARRSKRGPNQGQNTTKTAFSAPELGAAEKIGRASCRERV